MSKVNLRVLVADEWDTWADLFRDLLPVDYNIMSANRLEDAKNKIRSSVLPYHIVITDIQFTADPSHDLRAGRHTLLDEILARGSYTESVLAISHGPKRNEIVNIMTNYGIKHYLEKFREDGKVFDRARFRDIMAQAATDATRKAREIIDCEQLQNLSRKEFSVFPEFDGEPISELCLALLPSLDASLLVHDQIEVSIGNLQVHRPSLACHCVPYDIKREREQVWPAINKANLIIADLAGLNPDVFYELGLCDALGKQRVLLIEEGQNIPRSLNVFPHISYAADKWDIQELATTLSNVIGELIDIHAPAHPLGKLKWGLSEVKTETVLILLPRSGAPAKFHRFLKQVTELRGRKAKEVRCVFDSRYKAEAAWKDINRAGVVLADISIADPEVLYAIGLGHAKDRPVVLITSNEETIPSSLRGLDCFGYSLDWDPITIKQKRDELDAAITRILNLYNVPETPAISQATIPPCGYPLPRPSITVSPPTDPDTFTWLHLSDLHFEDTEQRRYQIGQVVKALIADLEDLRERDPELKPDTIFFTGDLANKAKSEEYAKAWEKCLDRVLQGCELQPANLFIVPGNHDVNRTQTTELDESIVRGLSDASQIYALLHDAKWAGFRQQLLQRMDIYQDSISSISGLSFDAKALSWGQILKTRSGKRIGIVGLNSAWTSASVKGTDGEVDDQGKLIVGKPLVEEALEQIRCNQQEPLVCVTLMHHPPDWLKDWDRKDVEQKLMESCGFLLHGHAHRTMIRSLGPDSNTMVISAGTLFKKMEGKDAYTCLHAYNIVRLNLAKRKGTIYLRRLDPTSWRYGADDTTFRGIRDGQHSFEF